MEENVVSHWLLESSTANLILGVIQNTRNSGKLYFYQGHCSWNCKSVAALPAFCPGPSTTEASLAQKLTLKLIHCITFLGNLKFASGKDFYFLSSLKKARSVWDTCFICTIRREDHVLFYKCISRKTLSFNSLQLIWIKKTEHNKYNTRYLILFIFIFYCLFTLPLLS